jgi:hypothetical protein
MAEQNSPKRDERARSISARIGRTQSREQRPDHLLQAIGKNYQILHSAKVDAEGNFALPADALKNSEQSRQ